MPDSKPSGADTADATPQDLPSRITFVYREAENQLQAVLVRSDNGIKETLFGVKNGLAEAGFGDYLVFAGELEAAVVKAAAGEVGEYVIGEKRDADISVSIATSKLGAYVDTQPAYGGEKLTKKYVLAAIKKQGIVDECLDHAAIAQVVNNSSVTNLRIAKAIPPERGHDAEFEPLVQELKTLSPKQLETGEVDYRQQMEFVVVEPGTPLMRRKPATTGKPGMDVTGDLLPAETGNDPGFNDAAEGAVVDGGDPNVLIAEIKGHPVLIHQGVKVDPTLTLDSVNIQSGDIDFDGSVIVRGDVESGYSLRVTGDISVKGVVDKATLIAKGSIHIAGGIIGDDKSMQRGKPAAARVQAGGDISARYVNAAELQAGQRILVREYLIHSKVAAKGEVCVGQEGGRGSIIGGICHSQTAVLANELGSDAYIPTRIDVGRENKLAPQLNELLTRRAEKLAERVKLDEILVKLKGAAASGSKASAAAIQPEKLQKILNTVRALDNTLETFDAKIAGVKAALAALPVSKVYARKTVYPNVGLRIDGAVFTEKKGRRGVTWVRDGADVVVAD